MHDLDVGVRGIPAHADHVDQRGRLNVGRGRRDRREPGERTSRRSRHT